jgi:hypothetical protein
MANGLYAQIAQGPKPLQIESPLNLMAQVTNVRSAQQQQQVNALKMREMERTADEQNRLRELFADPTADYSSPDFQRKMLSVSPKAGLEYQKSLIDRDKARIEAEKTNFELVSKKTDFFRDALATVNTPQDAQVWTAAIYSDPILSKTVTSMGGNLEQALARIPTDPAQFAQWKQQTALGAKKFIELNKPQFMQQDTGGESRIVATPGLGGETVVVPGSVVQKTLSPADAARERRERDVDLQQRLADAKAYGTEMGKNRRKVESDTPGAIQTANEGIRLIDQMIGTPTIKDKSGKVIQKGTAPHSGFQDYVGFSWKPGARFIDGSNAASFEARHNQITGQAFLQAFETLKGGGHITEIEGTKATQAITRMSKSQTEAEYIRAAREFQDILRKGAERARREAAAVGAAPTTPNTAGNIHDQARRIIEGQ